jgi:hypothetical protein
MRTPNFAVMALLAFALTAGAAEEAFKLYPGATKYTPPDTAESRQWASALPPGTKITAYLTNDSFEQVVAFYRGLGRSYSNPNTPVGDKLPNGQRMEKAFVIFDDAPDLRTSRRWISIQHPFIRWVSGRKVSGKKGGVAGHRDVTDVTEIVLTEKQAVPQKTR